jgi:uncharacterized protein YbjT (DUF2867 family)
MAVTPAPSRRDPGSGRGPRRIASARRAAASTCHNRRRVGHATVVVAATRRRLIVALGEPPRMHIVITGATGNVGTSVVESLASDAGVTSILGLARWLPNWQAPKTQWAQADVAKDELAPHLRGADVRIHLAWLFQPTHNPVTTWRANVEGSIRVFHAAAAGGHAGGTRNVQSRGRAGDRHRATGEVVVQAPTATSRLSAVVDEWRAADPSRGHIHRRSGPGKCRRVWRMPVRSFGACLLRAPRGV